MSLFLCLVVLCLKDFKLKRDISRDYVSEVIKLLLCSTLSFMLFIMLINIKKKQQQKLLVMVGILTFIQHFHRYHTVFLPSDVFRLILSQMRKNKKQKIETVNSYIKNLLTDTCESRDKVYISF